ncbi:YfbU family protein [Enterococcus faecium]|uniref:YfbU family protein n=1 Tax=Enterococcus faecium TaxID=1352 RepID=UPI0023EF0C01|nr:YfbU family protein [Enterococcus faecium]
MLYGLFTFTQLYGLYLNSIDNYYIQFKGFDFNSSTEFKLALYAQFFIEKLNRFQEIVEDSDFNTFNSHKPMRGTYIKFLENYNDLKSTNNYQFGNLSYEMISKVLSL